MKNFIESKGQETLNPNEDKNVRNYEIIQKEIEDNQAEKELIEKQIQEKNDSQNAKIKGKTNNDFNNTDFKEDVKFVMEIGNIQEKANELKNNINELIKEKNDLIETNISLALFELILSTKVIKETKIPKEEILRVLLQQNKKIEKINKNILGIYDYL